MINRADSFTPEAYWHISHDRLLEWTTEPIEKRIAFIKANKPKREHETRLRLLRRVKGALPLEFVEAHRAYGAAWLAYDEAYRAYGAACRAYDEAYRAYGAAWLAYAAAAASHRTTIEALHAAECPDCPWDGNTIFPSNGYPA